MQTPLHRFGGNWTDEKLAMLGGYLHAYNIALQRQPFRRVYIDAFAGTGYRTQEIADKQQGSLLDHADAESHSDEQREMLAPRVPIQRSLYQELPEPAIDSNDGDDTASLRFLDGSARIALQAQPAFHRYIFMEKNQARARELQRLRVDFPDVDVEVWKTEANAALQQLCQVWDWRGRRAVLFLDPYGAQIEWQTLKAIAETQAIDLWLLFPMLVNRMLPRDGNIPPAWHDRLCRLFGTDSWRSAFYRTEQVQTFFGDASRTKKKIDFDGIKKYFVNRLETIFPAVAKNPRLLLNSRQSPLYLLCFAVSNPNPKAIKPALRIAEYLLKN